MTEQSFDLPYPDPLLNPNCTKHWRKIAAAKKQARNYAMLVTRQKVILIGVKLPLWVQYDIYPPDRRQRDGDNARAACKAYQDGIADALKINDYHFITSDYFHKDNPVKDGKVVVTIKGDV